MWKKALSVLVLTAMLLASPVWSLPADTSEDVA